MRTVRCNRLLGGAFIAPVAHVYEILDGADHAVVGALERLLALVREQVFVPDGLTKAHANGPRYPRDLRERQDDP